MHYLEDCEPKVKSHTGYMRNMYKHILTIIEALEGSGYDKLLTFCHGDAKPNNFLFRSIEIDIEELECEGLQSILIDWQGGFLGCAANDLMWALFPFLEANAEDKVSTIQGPFTTSRDQLIVHLVHYQTSPLYYCTDEFSITISSQKI